ncbi:Hypothetical predicted protein [Paramuricea clavata]|uniref:Uncharacterized protein n=1 Tax=Paramuricea clavata TaxID=317549 RepID=A0A7D9IX52_PARCT|nr:Hypothetical predicted protein [Paramuricea clavata]
MADDKVNEAQGKSNFSDEDEERLLAEEGEQTQDYVTTGDTNNDSTRMWEAIKGLGKKLDLLAGTPNTRITDAPLKRKIPHTVTKESKNDAETPPGSSRQKKRKSSSVCDDASDDSDRDVTALLDKEDEQDGDESDKLLQEIEEEYNSEDKTGPDVNVHLANLVNKRFAGKLKEAKLKEKCELYIRPGNCDKLKVPLVNPELWGKLGPPVKTQDLRIANVQQTIVKATVALTEATERITKVKGNIEGKQQIITSLTDSLALLGHATYDLSLRRRDIMRPSINRELRALCSPQIPVTEFLFGDDVQNSLKTITECNKIASSTVKQGSDYKHKPTYSRGGNYKPQASQGYGHGSKPFLGQRKGYQPFKKKVWTPQHKREDMKWKSLTSDKEIIDMVTDPEIASKTENCEGIFSAVMSNTHIRLKIDNTTAVAAINHMGTSHSIQSEHIPGKYNICHFKSSSETGAGQGNRSNSNPQMAHPGVVFHGNEDADQLSSSSTAQCQTVIATKPPTRNTPLTQETGSASMSLVRGQLQTSGLSTTASDIFMCAWRDGTKKQYQTYLTQWENYCNSKGISPVSATVIEGINFLAELVDRGIGYSAVNTARSALSTILVANDSLTFGMHPLVKRFLKGVFEQKPSLPRYAFIWDVNQVLNRLRSYPSIECISLKELTLKLVMLLALLTGQRTQAIILRQEVSSITRTRRAHQVTPTATFAMIKNKQGDTYEDEISYL